MMSKDFPPSLHLKEYIRRYRLRHFVFPHGMVPPPDPFPPRPEQCVTFFIRGSEVSRHLKTGIDLQKPRSVFCGQFTYRIDRLVSYPEILMFSVDFQPGALYRLIGIPFTNFTNKEIDAETVLPKIKSLNDRLRSAASYREIVQPVECYFTQLVRSSTKGLLAVDRLLSTVIKEPDHSIDWLARNAFLSLRQLERTFDERIGIGPKTFLRISRFSKSYWLHIKNPDLNWYKIAMICGYTDYQHLVKEYKEFASASPNTFFKEQVSAQGHILSLTT